MVAFQISSEKQICSANTPSSTIRRPSLHLLLGAGVDVCFFCHASAGASTARIFSQIYHFVLVSRSPFAGQHSHNGSEIQKQQLNTPKIFRTTAHTGIARCAENVRISNRGHRP